MFRTCNRISLLACVLAALPIAIPSRWMPLASAQDQAPVDAANDASAHANRHAGELGVLVSSSPGNGVYVMDVIPGSPAAKADIRPGDYIMDINDEDVSTPIALKEKIEGLSEFDTIDVTLWRQGQDINLKIGLAAESKQLPESHRAWLGVMLSPTDKGMRVDFVHPSSPAADAGLMLGDVITMVDGKNVQSTDAFVQTVQEMGPGKEIKLTIRRRDAEQSLLAKIGEIDAAPISWFHPQRLEAAASQGIEEMIDELRVEIQRLKKEVEQLKSHPAADKGASLRSVNDPASNARVVYVQHGGHGGGHGRDGHYGGNVGGYYGGHYGGGYRGGVNIGGGLGGLWGGSVLPYYPPVIAPLYSSGYYYPYQYYGYGGQPYFYGGSYPYGYRGGVRIGPNFSVGW
jgi:serine protease Do